MTLAEYWRVLARHRLLAVLPVVVLVGAALLWSAQTTPVYTASASALITGPSGAVATDAPTQLGSYAKLATSPIVIDPVIESLGLDTTASQLAAKISATVVPSSAIFQIAATDSDPQSAARIANAVTAEVAQVAKDLAPSTTDKPAAVSVTVVSPATPPKFTSSPQTKRNVLAGAMLGIFLGLVLPILREILDSKVRGADDLPVGLPLLATLPRVKSMSRSGSRNGRSRRADFVMTESLRKVQADLRFLDADRPIQLIALSSSLASEGKTSLSIRLASVLADGSGDVLLVDADLRRPEVAKRLGMDGNLGLTDVLAGSVTLDQAVQQAQTPRLHVLPAGGTVRNPVRLLSSEPMAALMDTLRERYDFVVLNTPPLLPVADGAVVATNADGLLLTVRSGKVTRAQVASSLEQLRRVDARVLGAVINMAPPPSRWRSRSNYYSRKAR